MFYENLVFFRKQISKNVCTHQIVICTPLHFQHNRLNLRNRISVITVDGRFSDYFPLRANLT